MNEKRDRQVVRRFSCPRCFKRHPRMDFQGRETLEVDAARPGFFACVDCEFVGVPSAWSQVVEVVPEAEAATRAKEEAAVVALMEKIRRRGGCAHAGTRTRVYERSRETARFVLLSETCDDCGAAMPCAAGTPAPDSVAVKVALGRAAVRDGRVTVVQPRPSTVPDHAMTHEPGPRVEYEANALEVALVRDRASPLVPGGSFSKPRVENAGGVFTEAMLKRMVLPEGVLPEKCWCGSEVRFLMGDLAKVRSRNQVGTFDCGHYAVARMDRGRLVVDQGPPPCGSGPHAIRSCGCLTHPDELKSGGLHRCGAPLVCAEKPEGTYPYKYTFFEAADRAVLSGDLAAGPDTKVRVYKSPPMERFELADVREHHEYPAWHAIACPLVRFEFRGPAGPRKDRRPCSGAGKFVPSRWDGEHSWTCPEAFAAYLKWHGGRDESGYPECPVAESAETLRAAGRLPEGTLLAPCDGSFTVYGSTCPEDWLEELNNRRLSGEVVSGFVIEDVAEAAPDPKPTIEAETPVEAGAPPKAPALEVLASEQSGSTIEREFVRGCPRCRVPIYEPRSFCSGCGDRVSSYRP